MTMTTLTRDGHQVAAIVPLERIMPTTALNPLPVDRALRILVDEGYEHIEVLAAIDSLVDAGLDLPQPEDGYLLTAAELDVLRRQLVDTVGTVCGGGGTPYLAD